VSGSVDDVISSFSVRGLAGFLVGRGELGFAEALAAPTLGSLVGALVAAAGLAIRRGRRGG
jgi:membrane protein DedA with SNARE-associated domain